MLNEVCIIMYTKGKLIQHGFRPNYYLKYYNPAVFYYSTQCNIIIVILFIFTLLFML